MLRRSVGGAAKCHGGIGGGEGDSEVTTRVVDLALDVSRAGDSIASDHSTAVFKRPEVT